MQLHRQGSDNAVGKTSYRTRTRHVGNDMGIRLCGYITYSFNNVGGVMTGYCITATDWAALVIVVGLAIWIRRMIHVKIR